jgi:O-antigen/teichoic acid export membrane protein
VFLGADFAVQIVAGHGYGRSVDVLRILSVALVGTFVIAARGYALLSLGRLRAMLASNAVALSVVGGAGIPLTVAHGAVGAAIALAAAELTLGACYELALTRRRRELRPTLGFIGRTAFAAALAVAPAIALDLPSVLAVVTGAAIYVGALFALRVVPTELRQALWPARAPTTGGS